MQLPFALRQAIEQEAASLPSHSVAKAFTALSEKYRAQNLKGNAFITGDADRLAYTAVRMPATFAAVRAALMEVRDRPAPVPHFESLLDLGAGTGAASWAAAEVFDQLNQFTMVEQDVRLIELGQKLAQSSDHRFLKTADWQRGNLAVKTEFAPHDLVICSYALNEIESVTARRILKAAWEAARQMLVIVEPGTMKGFEVILAAREQLIEAGAFVVAPCPHQNTCPMALADSADWCHFAARFDRTPLHRRLKGGTLGYEDEKFSYLAVSKSHVSPAAARVLRHPKRHAGYTQLQLCTPAGLQHTTITKRDKDAWKQARKTDWGESWQNS